MPVSYIWEWESSARHFTKYDFASSNLLEKDWQSREPRSYLSVLAGGTTMRATVDFNPDTSLQSGMQYTSATNYTVGRLVRRVMRVTPDEPLGASASGPLSSVTAAQALSAGHDSCAVCCEDYSDTGSAVTSTLGKLSCGHVFHADCIAPWLKQSPRCPNCNTWVQRPTGTCPDGTMDIAIEKAPVGGHEACGCHTYVVRYSIPSGTQHSVHSSPGMPFYGTERVTYVPTCSQGQELMELLCKMFTYRMVFMVGTSLSTGHSDSVIWSGRIHHKTVKNGGGEHAFPDVTGVIRMIGEAQDALADWALPLPSARPLMGAVATPIPVPMTAPTTSAATVPASANGVHGMAGYRSQCYVGGHGSRGDAIVID
jgi:deltex-like protein